MRAAALVLFALPALAADIYPVNSHIPGGGFRWSMPQYLANWKQLAIQAIGPDVEKPSATRILDLFQNQDSQGNTEVNFPVRDTPEAFQGKKFYVVSTWGITPLALRYVMGSVRYGFDADNPKPEVKRVAFGGAATFEAVPDEGFFEAGFLWVADGPLTSEAVDLPEGALTIEPVGTATSITYTLDGVARSGRVISQTTSHTEAATLITTGQERYLYIQWKQERGSCAYMFSLLKINGAALEDVGSNVYGCER